MIEHMVIEREDSMAKVVDVPRLARAGMDDFDAMATLFAALHAHNAALDSCFGLAPNWRTLLREHFSRTYTDAGALWLLAWDDTDPVGLLLMESHQDSPLFTHRRWAELVALYVAPEFRGAGLARQLADAARAWAATQGFDRIQLYVTATNDRARNFYRRCGFNPVQEIWRLEVEPQPGMEPPADPSCMPEAGCGVELLEQGHHHLAMETAHAAGNGNSAGSATLTGYAEHKQRVADEAPRGIACGVLTASDTRTPETDTSGDLIREHITRAGHAVTRYTVVPDEAAQIVELIHNYIQAGCAVIILNGGTGIAKRDSTFEAVDRLLQKRLPGFGELFRMLSYTEIGPGAMLSRATAGVYRDTLIFSLPGSPNAVELAMQRLILPELAHLVWETVRR